MILCRTTAPGVRPPGLFFVDKITGTGGHKAPVPEREERRKLRRSGSGYLSFQWVLPLMVRAQCPGQRNCPGLLWWILGAWLRIRFGAIGILNATYVLQRLFPIVFSHIPGRTVRKNNLVAILLGRCAILGHYSSPRPR